MGVIEVLLISGGVIFSGGGVIVYLLYYQVKVITLNFLICVNLHMIGKLKAEEKKIRKNVRC